MPFLQNFVWRGTKELVLGKAHWDVTAEKTTVTTEVTGPYEALLKGAPQIGQTITGFGNIGLKITSCKYIELDGSAGRVEIVMEVPTPPSDQITTDTLGSPTYEVEFGEVQRPLETHDRCGRLKSGRPSHDGKQRTWENWQQLDSDDYDSSFSRPNSSGNVWTLAEYKSLKEEGEDSYVVYTPVIRRTTFYFRPPSDLGHAAGKKQSPPVAAAFYNTSAFQWLGGPDRCTKNKRLYTRTTEWIGAPRWASLAYANASS